MRLAESECRNAALAWHGALTLIRTHTHGHVIHSILFDICSQLFRRKCFSAAKSKSWKILTRRSVWSSLCQSATHVHFPQNSEIQCDRLTMNPYAITTISPSQPWAMSNVGRLGTHNVADGACAHANMLQLLRRIVYGEWLMTKWQYESPILMTQHQLELISAFGWQCAHLLRLELCLFRFIGRIWVSLSLHFLAWRVLCSCDTREEQKWHTKDLRAATKFWCYLWFNLCGLSRTRPTWCVCVRCACFWRTTVRATFAIRENCTCLDTAAVNQYSNDDDATYVAEGTEKKQRKIRDVIGNKTETTTSHSRQMKMRRKRWTTCQSLCFTKIFIFCSQFVVAVFRWNRRKCHGPQ